eukprot:149090-Chlamydomonas_euryale.AAC.1
MIQPQLTAFSLAGDPEPALLDVQVWGVVREIRAAGRRAIWRGHWCIGREPMAWKQGGGLCAALFLCGICGVPWSMRSRD